MRIEKYINKRETKSGIRYDVHIGYTTNTFNSIEEARNYIQDFFNMKKNIKKERVLTSKYVGETYPANLMEDIVKRNGKLWLDWDYSEKRLETNLLLFLKKGRIKEREYQFLLYRYKDMMTLDAIGMRFGLTRERVRQIVDRVVGKISLSVMFDVLNTNNYIVENMKRIEELQREVNIKKDRLEKALKDMNQLLENKVDIRINIEELDLSTRSYNWLMRNGFKYVDEVVDYVKDDIWKLKDIRNLGVKSILEIGSKLNEMGYGYQL